MDIFLQVQRANVRFKIKGILHIRSYACCKYVGVKMTGGPKRGQP